MVLQEKPRNLLKENMCSYIGEKPYYLKKKTFKNDHIKRVTDIRRKQQELCEWEA